MEHLEFDPDLFSKRTGVDVRDACSCSIFDATEVRFWIFKSSFYLLPKV